MTDPLHSPSDDTTVQPDPPSPPRTPRWVKISAIIAGVVIVLVVALLISDSQGLGGEHGPGRHAPGDGPPLDFDDLDLGDLDLDDLRDMSPEELSEFLEEQGEHIDFAEFFQELHR